MSVFVDAAATFPIIAKFRRILNEEGKTIGVKVLPSDAHGDDVNVFICWARGRDFDTVSRIKEAAGYINPVNGEMMVYVSVLCRQIFLNFLSAWNIDSPSGVQVPITAQNVGSLYDSLTHAIALKWLRITDGRPLKNGSNIILEYADMTEAEQNARITNV